MRHRVTWAFLLVFLASPFSGQAGQWSRHSNQTGNFSVLLPGLPTESLNGDQSQQVSHTVQAISAGVAYTVVFVVNKTDQPVDEPTFKIYRDAVMKSLPNCEIATETSASPVLEGYIGRWYRMRCKVEGKDLTFIGNLYWGKRYAYAVLTMFVTSSADPPDAPRFANSFSVLDRSR